MQPLLTTIPKQFLTDKIFLEWYDSFIVPREQSRIEMHNNNLMNEAMSQISKRHNDSLRIDPDNTFITKYIEQIYKPMMGIK